jgi:transposase
MRYLGMDVAKAKLDCLLLSEEGDKGKSKSVANNRLGVADFLVWIGKQHISPAELHVVMDATGVYHEQAALALSDAGVTVSIVNPAQVKDFGRGLAVRTKTDGMDSLSWRDTAHCSNPLPGHHPHQRRGWCKPCWLGAMLLPKICSVNAIDRKRQMPPTPQR